MPDQAGKQQRTRRLRHQTEASERHHEPRQSRRDHQVGVRQHRRADADRRAVHRRHQRVASATTTPPGTVRPATPRRSPPALEILDVVARGEAVARAAQQHHADGWVLIGRRNASTTAAYIAPVRAFFFSGRLNWISSTGPACVTRMSLIGIPRLSDFDYPIRS